MITYAKDNFMECYEYDEKYKNHGPKWMVEGVDTFDYGDYTIALCDTKEEAELVANIEIDKQKTSSATMKEQIWMFGPRGTFRQRVY